MNSATKGRQRFGLIGAHLPDCQASARIMPESLEGVKMWRPITIKRMVC